MLLDVVYDLTEADDESSVGRASDISSESQAELVGRTLESRLFLIYKSLVDPEVGTSQAAEQLNKLVLPLGSASDTGGRLFTAQETEILWWIAESEREAP